MKKLFLLILFVLNLVLLQAQEVKFISVNEADTTFENITFKKLPKLLQKDTLTADALAAPAKWMLKFQKKLSKQQRSDSNIYIFFCHHPQDSLTAFLPLSGKYGYVLFDTAKTGVVELEKLQLRLSTRKYQWDLIHDPEKITLALFQDEDEGASVLNDVFSIVELVRDAALNNKECKIPIYSHTVIDNIYDIASDKTIEEDIARRYSGLKFQIQFDENSIEKKVCTFSFDDVEIQAYDLSQTNPAYDFQSSVSIVTKDENKRALVTFNCNKSNVALVKEFLFGDVEKDCAPIIEGITKNLNENKEVDLSELSASCAAKIPLETRKKLINYILNKWWVSEKYEHALLVLIEQVQDENVDDFISYLRNDKLDDKFVYQQLMSAIDDINGKDYYAALMQVFTRLLLRQSEYASGEPELKEIILVGKKPWFNISEIPEFEYRYKEKPSYNADGDIEVTYKIRLLIDAELKTTSGSIDNPNAIVPHEPITYLDKTFEWKSDNLSYTYDPLSLVFVAKQSETANVEDILQEETAEGVIVPAALLMYNSDKIMQQNIEQGVYITLDAASIFLSGGTLAYVKAAGKTISATRKALLLLEVANGVVNLTVNLTELSVNPEAQKFLFYYNLGTAGFNLACSAKNIKWLRQGGKVLDGCENISETLVRRMSKYDETKRVGFFNDFGSDRSLLNQVDNLSDTEFDELMKRYNIDLEVDTRKEKVIAYLAGEVDDVVLSFKTRLLSKIEGKSGLKLTLTDNELDELIAFSRTQSLTDADIDALLIVHARKNWVGLEGMKEVATSIAAKSTTNTIKFKSGWDFKKAFREGQERLLNGSYLPSEEYLDASYILQHKNSFNNKASYLMTKDQYNLFVKDKSIIGRPDGQFVSTTERIDDVLKKADKALYNAKELGIPPGEWSGQGGIVRVDVSDLNDYNPRIPYGSESGANELWNPGGYTSGGVKELVIDEIPEISFKIHFVITE